jgi:hypothetical protein
MAKPIIPEREWLARLYEAGEDDGQPAPGVIRENLVDRAQAFFEQKVAELCATRGTEAALAAYGASVDEVGAEPLVRGALQRGFEQARRETAKALRDGTI